MRRNVGLIIIYIFLIICIIGTGGCTFIKSKKESVNDIVNSMESYLNRKYGYFSYEEEGFVSSGWDQEYDSLYLSTTINGIEEHFAVDRYKIDGEYKFCDNYFGLLIKDDFINLVSSYSDKYFLNNKVYASLTENLVCDEITKNSTLEDYFNQDLKNITFFIMVKEDFSSIEEFNKNAKQFIDDWKQEKIISTPRIIYLTEENYNNLNSTNYGDFLVNNRITEYHEIINKEDLK